jgi:salicylate hydroxylase
MPAIHFPVCLPFLTLPLKAQIVCPSHNPTPGAFGSGAAFALEDAWILSQALVHTRSANRPLVDALRIFDSIRSPYYLRMYEHLDQQKRIIQEAKASAANRSFEEVLQARTGAFGSDKLGWIYGNDIQEVWNEYLKNAKDE